MWRNRTNRFCAAGSLLLILTFAAGCHKEAAITKAPTPVRVEKAAWATSGSANTYSANIQPYAQVDLSFKSNGYIAGILQVKGPDGRMRSVGEGDFVRKGTVLATVDEADFKQKLSQAEAQLSHAQADYDRAKLSFDRTSALYKAGAATQPDYDNATAQLASTKASVQGANASVSEAKIALGYCQLRAPFNSWVVKRNVDVGSLVGPATNGFTVADTRQVKAVFGVPDTMLSQIRLGSPETVLTEALGKSFRGRVTAISPAADPKSRVYSVEVTIPNPQNALKIGMIASITIPGAEPEKTALIVPLSSIVQSPDNANGFSVFVTDGSGNTTTVRQQNVSLGSTYGDKIAVTSGLNPGDPVVTAGASMIRNGEHVRVVP